MVTVTTPGGEWGKGQGEKIRTLRELNDRTRKSSVTPFNADIITTVAGAALCPHTTSPQPSSTSNNQPTLKQLKKTCIMYMSNWEKRTQ